MAFFKANHVQVAGMAACVPSKVEESAECYSKWGG